MQDLENRGTSADRPAGGRLLALLAVNAALLVLLGVVTFNRPAEAQIRPRGDYTIVAGGVQGAESHAIYIVDTSGQELVVLSFEPNTKSLVGIGYRSLAADAVAVTRGGRPR